MGVNRLQAVEDTNTYRVCSSQIDPNPTRPGGEDEAKDLGVGIEPRHEDLPLLGFRGPIQPHIGVTVQVHKNLENIQHSCHLGEDQAPMAASLEPPEQRGHLLQLPAVVLDELCVRHEHLLTYEGGAEGGGRLEPSLLADEGSFCRPSHHCQVGPAAPYLLRHCPCLGDVDEETGEEVIEVIRSTLKGHQPDFLDQG